MKERDRGSGSTAPAGPALLYVTTVATTLRQFIAPFAAHFRSLGWRVDAAAGSGPTGVDGLRDMFDNVYEIPLSRSILNAAGMVRSERSIARILDREPDIVHVHTPIAGFVTRAAVRRRPTALRPAVVYTAHGFHFHETGHPVTNAVFLTAERVAGRWTDRLVVINEDDELAARRHHIVPSGRLVRMPGIGIDTAWYARSNVPPEAIAAVRPEFSLAANAPLFVVVGELNANKRQRDAIAALASMRNRDAVMVLAGAGGERARLEALAHELHVADRVRFAGFVSDVRPVLCAATAMILPSKREGLARSVMEALSLEVPVIVSTARGNRELVGTDRGFIYPTGDVRALARLMDQVVDERLGLRGITERGRAEIAARFDFQILVRRHEQLYARLLAERRRA